MAKAAPVTPTNPSGPRKEAELVHKAFVSEQERQARAAAGAQKQLDEAAAAAKKREKEKERKKRQKEAKKSAARAEREHELPAPPTLGAYIDLTGLECDNDSANVMSSLIPNAAVFVPQG